MCSCWQENPDNRPTFETLYMRFDEFMIQAEPSYREVRARRLACLRTDHIGVSLDLDVMQPGWQSVFPNPSDTSTNRRR